MLSGGTDFPKIKPPAWLRHAGGLNEYFFALTLRTLGNVGHQPSLCPVAPYMLEH